MFKIEEVLLELAQKQLDGETVALEDASWVDELIAEAQKKVPSNKDEFKSAFEEILKSLEENKEQIKGLGKESFALFLYQLSNKKESEALDTAMAAKHTAKELIAAMRKGIKSLIEAKKKIDEMRAEALELVKTIATAGVKALLPIALDMLSSS